MKTIKNILITITLITFAITANSQCVQCDNNSNALGSYSSVIGMSTTTTANSDGAFAGGYGSTADGAFAFAFGNQVSAVGTNSLAIGRFLETSSTPSMVLGIGYDLSHKLVDSISNSLMIGFNSDKPTFFVGQSNGIGTTGKIGIGNVTDPQAKLHIKGDENGSSSEDADILLEPGNSMKYARVKFGTTGNKIEARGSLDLNFHTASDFVFWDANVGIGTVNPSEKLDVTGTIKSTGLKLIDGNQGASKILQSDADGNASWVDPMSIGVDDGDWEMNGNNVYRLNGNVGIGTGNPNCNLDVNGTARVNNLVIGSSNPPYYSFYISDNNNDWTSIFQNTATEGKGLLIKAGHSTYPDNPILQLADNGGAVKFTVKADGDVNIAGNLAVDQNVEMPFLTVTDKIEAGMIEVKEISKWQDDVFKPEYGLRTLSETEQYIKENGHLPEIPSETEVMQNGYNLTEMDAKLLQKIEELTLYVIELKKEIKELKGE